MTVSRRVGYRDVNIGEGLGEFEDAFASKPAPTFDRVIQADAVKCGSGLAREEARNFTAKPQTGKLVVDLISDNATIEFTSWIPGTIDSFSKKKRSYASMSAVTIRSKKSTDPIST